jgi:hypothetical protein
MHQARYSTPAALAAWRPPPTPGPGPGLGEFSQAVKGLAPHRPTWLNYGRSGFSGNPGGGQA